MPRMPVTELTKKVAALEARLNKKVAKTGRRVMTRVDLSPNTYFLRRPSGIMPLDIHTGGGLPAGGLTYLSGPDGAGKTFLLYKYIAMNQKLYGDKSAVALGASESAPDHFFMRKCGIQIAIPEKMIAERANERKERGLPPYTKEQLKDFRTKTVGEFELLLGEHGEEMLQNILECFKTGIFDIICLDSVSALLPEADALKDLDEGAKRAAAAGMLTRFFQYYLGGTTSGTNPTTVIFTSQVRSNSKKSEAPAHIQKYLPDFVPQGAWAAKHGKLIDILVKPGKKDKEDVVSTGMAVGSLGEMIEQEKERKKRVQIGKTVQYEVLKGKAGLHEGITGEFAFNFPGHTEQHSQDHQLTNDQRMVLVEALANGIAQEKEGLFSVYDLATMLPYPDLKDIAGRDTNERGIEHLAQMMRDDFELELRIRRMVLSAVGIECAYR
jgi:RecA/RadA recombinase